MQKRKNFKFINSLDLKILAMILMLCDHLWATLIPGNRWLTDIGRMAFPIFAFQIAEGYFETGNFKKYFKRLFICALISEIPFNLMYSGEIFFPFHQNVLFSFCLSLLLIRWIDRAKDKGRGKYIAVFILACILGFLGGSILMLDYFGFGVLTVLLFYFSRDKKFSWLIQLMGMLLINVFLMEGLTLSFSILGKEFFVPQQAFALLALIPIWLYNREQGPHNRAIQMLCYGFYPAHMLILAIIRSLI